VAFVDKYRKSGKLKDIYWFADGSGGVSIWNFASAEEAYTILHESPVFTFLDANVVPVMDYEGATKLRTAMAGAPAT